MYLKKEIRKLVGEVNHVLDRSESQIFYFKEEIFSTQLLWQILMTFCANCQSYGAKGSNSAVNLNFTITVEIHARSLEN